MSLKLVRNKANELREEYSPNLESFVDVHKIAKKLGIEICEEKLDEDVSGVLVMKNTVPFIFINEKQPENRQRFTIAHELGHYVIHHSDWHVNIGKSIKIYNRDSKSSSGEHLEEIEANQFAAELLMPKGNIDRFMAKNKITIFDEDSIERLAEFLKVSIQALSIRLAKLRYV
jgi:Zn-dependent peptidase ImmA (M78 family)